MLNVAVIGMGVGEKHALAYDNHKETELKKICDFNKEKLKEVKSKFPDVLFFENDQSVLSDHNTDIVSIATYDNYHHKQILKAFENSKHVMVEKPLCLHKCEMLEIHAAQKRNKDVKLSANHVLRTNSRFTTFKKDIKSGKYGEIFYMEGDYYWGRKHKLYGWRSEMDYYSIIYGAAIHMIDLIMWLTDSKPVSVMAMGNNFSTNESKLQFNTFAVILLKFNDGFIAKLTGNGGCVHPHFHGLKIFGTERTAIQDMNGAYCLDTCKPGSEPISIREPYPEKEAREKVIHSFVDSILDDSLIPLVPQNDVYNVMSVCFAAEEAMKTGQNTIIEYLN